MLENTIAMNMPQFTLDDVQLLASVRKDAAGFLNDNPPPIFIDEVQYAPELFRGIKMIVDKRKNEDEFNKAFIPTSEYLGNRCAKTLTGR